MYRDQQTPHPSTERQHPTIDPHPEMPSLSVARSSILSDISLFFWELMKIIVIAGVTIILVRFYLFKPFSVKGQSMYPTYQESEYLIVDRITPRFREYERGEVVVFRAPVGEQKDFYLKRLIGLPGEQVKIHDNKVIICNDTAPECQVIEEVYLSEDTIGSINILLQEGEYFVMGDNRNESYDSRQFGPVHRDAILGRTVFRGWPPSRMSSIANPTYSL